MFVWPLFFYQLKVSHQAESTSEAFAAVAILPKRAVEQAVIIEDLKEERSERRSLIVWLAL